jgi:hypothetical protein
MDYRSKLWREILLLSKPRPLYLWISCFSVFYNVMYRRIPPCTWLLQCHKSQFSGVSSEWEFTEMYTTQTYHDELDLSSVCSCNVLTHWLWGKPTKDKMQVTQLVRDSWWFSSCSSTVQCSVGCPRGYERWHVGVHQKCLTNELKFQSNQSQSILSPSTLMKVSYWCTVQRHSLAHGASFKNLLLVINHCTPRSGSALWYQIIIIFGKFLFCRCHILQIFSKIFFFTIQKIIFWKKWFL